MQAIVVPHSTAHVERREPNAREFEKKRKEKITSVRGAKRRIVEILENHAKESGK